MLSFSASEMTPGKFYALVDIIESVNEDQLEKLDAFRTEATKAAELVQKQCAVLAKANNDMQQEARTSLRVRSNSFDSLEKQSSDYRDFMNQVSDVNFLLIAFDTIRCIQIGYIGLLDLARNLRPKQLLLSDKRFGLGGKKTKDIQNMMYEFSLNAPAINSFISALNKLGSMKDSVNLVADKVYASLDTYYRKLLHRHTIEGMKIHKDPVITDIALLLFKNIDAHGEIAEGKDPDKVSAYTLRKAEILAEALRADSVHKFVQDPGSLIEYLTLHLKAFKGSADNLQILFQKQLDDYKNAEEDKVKWRNELTIDFLDKMLNSNEFEKTLTLLSDVDPRNVSYTESHKILSSEERFNQKFREETIERLADMLADPDFSAEELVKYVLQRKSKLQKYFQDENSFYVSKIGGGNPFTGVAPGALEIIPGQKPNSNLDDIVGSGFKEVKNFLQNIEDAAKWNSLFLATSPSKSTDKSNILLVGPQGAGKTEVFRAVASDKKSISISVQGSDFNTCWKGEMEKNPKRLFEGAVKLHKEANKHVHILIDEIDAVLNNDKGYGDTNLTLEFQILMDGVVHYPEISVWGATNNPERIPMPMIRRFSLITIVGELNQDNRVFLLKHFMNYIPLVNFTDDVWQDVAKRLTGATGDVIRKVCDDVWRGYMSNFVKNHPGPAEELSEWLNEESSFNINEFNLKKRNELKRRLVKFNAANPEDLQNATTKLLGNIGIIAEIATAKETYSNAKAFLSGVNTGAMFA